MKSSGKHLKDTSSKKHVILKRLFQLIQKLFTGLILLLTAVFLNSKSLLAQPFIENTHLVDVRVGAGLSEKVRKYSIGGYELSGGSSVRFKDWYSTDWSDLSFTLTTEINNNFGIYWGLSTGEIGLKYRIQPSLKIGFILLSELSQNSIVSLSATTILGGFLKEDTCTADYGAIGGIQTVNCRLAASVLPPAETLQFLFDDPPPERIQLTLRYNRTF